LNISGNYVIIYTTYIKGGGQAMVVASLIEDDILDIMFISNVKRNIINEKYNIKIWRLNDDGK
jgi:hypothetical protein